MAGNNQTKTET